MYSNYVFDLCLLILEFANYTKVDEYTEKLKYIYYAR